MEILFLRYRLLTSIQMLEGPSTRLLCVQENQVTQINNLNSQDASEKKIFRKSHNALRLMFLTFPQDLRA